MEENTILEKTNDKLKISKLVFLLASVSIIFVAIVFSVYININSTNLFFSTIDNIFAQIPLGNFIYLYLQSLQQIDINYFYANIFSPALLIETLYLIIPIIILQVLVLVLYYKTIKKDHAFISAFIGLIALFSMMYLQFSNNSIFSFIYDDLYQLKNIILSVGMIIQLAAFVSSLVYLNKLDRFSLYKLKTHYIARKFVKVGSIISSVGFVLISGGLLFLNAFLNSLKSQIAFERIIDVKAKAGGIIEIDVPSNIIDLLSRINITLPKSINGGVIIDRLGLSEIDLGRILNDFLSSQIDRLSNHFVIQPLIIIFFGVLLIVLVLVFEYSIKNIKSYKNIFIYLQMIATLILYFAIAKNFGILIVFSVGLILVGTIIHLITNLEEKQAFEKIKSKINDYVNKKQ